MSLNKNQLAKDTNQSRIKPTKKVNKNIKKRIILCKRKF